VQDLPYRAGGDLAAEADQFAVHAAMPPGGILRGQAKHEITDLLSNRWSSAGGMRTGRVGRSDIAEHNPVLLIDCSDSRWQQAESVDAARQTADDVSCIQPKIEESSWPSDTARRAPEKWTVSVDDLSAGNIPHEPETGVCPRAK
jgi:hypothetical protein